jgi:hypothetical protein
MSDTGQKTFCFALQETTIRDIAVHADSQDAALAMVREHYSRGFWIACPRRGFAHVLDEHGSTLEELSIF